MIGRVATPRARLVVGGLLVGEVPSVVAAFVAEGFRPVDELQHEGWVSLRLARHGTEEH